MKHNLFTALALILSVGMAWGQQKKPNILVIWGDDIGTWNISHNNRGMMGYKTPNIDRIAREGVGFTDYYAQQSCTAGRAAFIGGNVPVRTGMTKVGMPGAKEGWQKTLSSHPQLVVSDISMPEMNGIELSQKIKSDKRTSHIPVILLTAISGEDDQIKGLKSGANDYLTKPFNFNILHAKIENLLPLHKFRQQ